MRGAGNHPRLLNVWKWLQDRPDWQIILLFMTVTVALRLIAFHAYPYPKNLSPDCWANLFGARTFAKGLLTNPGKPWHQFFILDFPTEMMKYQPAMASFMAAGIVLFGHAHWGVVLCLTLAIGASYWCLRGWLAKAPAMLGTCILMLIFRAPHYWMYNYSGGSHILLASMLMLGAYPRIFLHHRYHQVIPGLLGFVLSLLGRPFEGGILACGLAICGGFTLFHWFNAEQRHQCLRTLWLPAVLILGSYASFQLYYNYRITGNAFELPYSRYHQRFDVGPNFTFEKPNYRNFGTAVPRGYQSFDLSNYFVKPHHRIKQTLDALLGILRLGKFKSMFPDQSLAAAVGILFHVPWLYMLYAFFARPTTRIYFLPLLVCSVFCWSGFAVTVWSYPHYLTTYFTVLYISLFVMWCDLRPHRIINIFVAMLLIALFTAVGGRIFL